MKKTEIGILLGFSILLIYLLPQNAEAACTTNPDWPAKPCLDVPNHIPSLYDQKIVWEKYYEYKGSKWMEMKKAELDYKIQSGNLKEWRVENSSNYNVWYYYYLNGYAPDPGKYSGNNPPDSAYICEKNELIQLDHTLDDDLTNLYYMCYDSENNKIDVSIAAFEETQIAINIPRQMLDPTNQFCEISDFRILLNKKPVDVVEFEPSTEYVSVIIGLEKRVAYLIEISEDIRTESEKCNPNLDISSPLKQLDNGIAPKDVTCKENLELIFKSTDDSPACVKSKTVAKLIERGWAMQTSSIDGFEECVAAGNPVMESYPRQCRTSDGRHFVEEIGQLQTCSRLFEDEMMCPEGYICYDEINGGFLPPGSPSEPIKSIGGDQLCHKECETDDDCPLNAPICRLTERTTEDYTESFKLCFPEDIPRKTIDENESNFSQKSYNITVNVDEEYSIAEKSKIILKHDYTETGYVDDLYQDFIDHYNRDSFVTNTPGFIDLNSGLLPLESDVIIADGQKSYQIENSDCKTEMRLSGDVGYTVVTSCDYTINEQPFSQSNVNLPKTHFTKEFNLINANPQKIILYEDEDKFLIMNYYGLGPYDSDHGHGRYAFGIPFDLITNYGLKNISILHLPGDYVETFQIGPDEIHFRLINAEQHIKPGTGAIFVIDEGTFHFEISMKTIDEPEKYPIRIIKTPEIRCPISYGEETISWSC